MNLREIRSGVVSYLHSSPGSGSAMQLRGVQLQPGGKKLQPKV
jgi:hypothetical protein